MYASSFAKKKVVVVVVVGLMVSAVGGFSFGGSLRFGVKKPVQRNAAGIERGSRIAKLVMILLPPILHFAIINYHYYTNI